MTDDTVTAKLAEWEALVEGATEGPWDNYRPNEAYRIHEVCSTTTQGLNETLAEVSGYNAAADAEFIAAAREMVPALLGFVREVRKIHRPFSIYTLAEECELPDEHEHGSASDGGDDICWDEPTGDQFCDVCRDEDGNRSPWPCPTVQALTERIGDA